MVQNRLRVPLDASSDFFELICCFVFVVEVVEIQLANSGADVPLSLAKVYFVKRRDLIARFEVFLLYLVRVVQTRSTSQRVVVSILSVFYVTLYHTRKWDL